MSSACAYRDGNTDGPMYDSNGKKCDTMNHTTKMLLIAGCSAAGAALVALGIYWLIRRARISRRSSQSEDGNNGVPARPLSAWVGQPGTMASGSNGYQYDTDGVDYQKYAARSRASSYMKAPDGSYSPVVGYAEEQQGLGYVPGSPSGSSMQQQQQQGNYYMQQQQQQQASYDPAATPTKRTSALNNNTNRRSYYDSNQQQHQPRGLPVPPQSAAMPPIRRYSQTSQEQDLNGDVYQYNYNYDNQDGRVRSPSPSRNRAASPSAYYAHRQSREYDQGYAYDGQGQGMEEEGRERVEMLSPDLRYIQPGR